MLRHILLQDTAEPQELLQETILLQEVFLTAHMAKAYEFPTPVRRSQTFKGWPDNSHGLLSMQLLPHTLTTYGYGCYNAAARHLYFMVVLSAALQTDGKQKLHSLPTDHHVCITRSSLNRGACMHHDTMPWEEFIQVQERLACSSPKGYTSTHMLSSFFMYASHPKVVALNMSMPCTSAHDSASLQHVFKFAAHVNHLFTLLILSSVLLWLQEGGLVKVEVVIGIPQRGPYHLALRQANPGTLFTGEVPHRSAAWHHAWLI